MAKCVTRLVSFAYLLASVAFSPSAQAAGVVATCNEASLDAALAGGGIVTFSCDGTITITSTKTIAVDTTIDASGHNVTISGSDQRQIFTVNSGIAANFVSLTLTDGLSTIGGGAIRSSGAVIITTCTISSSSSSTSSGGAIRINAGTATISNSSFLANSATSTLSSGGAIYINASSGPVNITNSTFYGNVAGSIGGGAIMNGGTLNVTNSTFNSNSAGNVGGAIATNGGTTNITHSIFFSSPTVNGGSLHRTGESLAVTISNSILFNTQSISECSGFSITDGGYNLAEDASCGFAAAGSLQIVTAEQLNLNPFGSNGGPTQTISPRPSSIAVDAIPAGTNGCGTTNVTDQREVVRPQRSNCDIGSVELQYRVPPRLISE